MIYAITFADSDKRYVGSAKDIGHRMRAHMSLLRKGRHHSIHLQRAFDRRSETDLSVTILEDGVPNEKLIEREQVWLDRFKGHLYNISPTASSRLGAKMSPSARSKISASLVGNDYRLGIPHDQETKDRIRRGVTVAYAEGRKPRESHPENLAEYNRKVSSGEIAAKHRKIASDTAVVEAFRNLKNYEAVGRQFGVTGAAIRRALRRVDPEILKTRWRHK